MLLLLLPAFIAFSFIYKTERLQKYADLINFKIDKTDSALVSRINSLQRLLSLTFSAFSDPANPSLRSYMSIISDEKTTLQINNELTAVKGIINLEVNAIQYKIKESLFSNLVSKILPQKRSRSLSDNSALEDTIRKHLQRKGLNYIDVKFTVDNAHVVFEQVIRFEPPSIPTLQIPDSLTFKNDRPANIKKANVDSSQSDHIKPQGAGPLIIMLEHCSSPMTPAERKKFSDLSKLSAKFSIENYLWCTNDDLKSLIRNRGYKITVSAEGPVIEIRSLTNNMYLKTSGKVLMVFDNKEIQFISPGETYNENELKKIYKP